MLFVYSNTVDIKNIHSSKPFDLFSTHKLPKQAVSLRDIRSCVWFHTYMHQSGAVVKVKIQNLSHYISISNVYQ